MKKIFSICLLSLLAIAATAQTPQKHRFKLTVQPEHFRSTTVSFNDAEGQHAVNNDTTDIDMMVPAGTHIYVRNDWRYLTGLGSLIPMHLMENGTEVPFLDSNGHVMNGSTSDYYFYYYMPDYDVDLVAIYEYDPTPPNEQPAVGGWYPETGTLVMDYNNYNYPSNFNYSEDKGKVLRYIAAWPGLTVIQMANNILYDFTNTFLMDYSRTTATRIVGYSNQTDETWRERMKNVTELVVPSTIQTIQSMAFAGTSLQTLTCYALIPPTFEIQTVYNRETQQQEPFLPFQGTPDIVVRVPADAVPFYQNAEYWKEMTIVPMDEDNVTLTVNILQTANANVLALYKGMHLQLTNRRSGMTRSLLVGTRNSYEFHYLPTKTYYDLALVNNQGAAVASIGNIFMDEADMTVTFSDLKTPHKLTLTLEESDGKPINEDSYANTWMKGDGTYLKRGTVLDDVLDGEALRFFPMLGNELAMKFEQPDTINYIVGQDGDDHHIRVQLSTLTTTTASFTVIDSLSRQGIEKATIDVAQVLPDGSMGSRVLLTTDAVGKATGQMLATMSFITVTSPLHGSKTFSANLADSTAFRTAFLPAEGTTIQLFHTFQAAVADDATPSAETTTDALSVGRNLEYTFTAKLPDGRDSLITDYVVSYPVYKLYNSLPQGTVLHVSATSPKDDIEPAEAMATVDENNTANVTLPIVERGYIHVSYQLSESTKPAVLLFNNSTGELLKKQAFGDYTFADFTSLPAGNYLVAAMSKGLQYMGINNRSQLQLYTADKDYVSKEVNIGKGRMANVSFSRVPYTMTQLESNLTTRRAVCTDDAKVGYYANIGVTVAFEGLKEHFYGEAYDENDYPTDCRLEVYVPEGFSQLSAARSYRQYKVYYQGTGIGTPVTIDEVNGTGYTPGALAMKTADMSWENWSRKLTIKWPHIDEGGRMSISMVPTKAGTFVPEVYLYYTLDGKEYCEMLETNTMTVSKSGIYVQELAISPSFIVSGTTQFFDEEDESSVAGARGPKKSSYSASSISVPLPPYYHVTVMDDGQPIGQAQIKSDGTWEAQCQLNNPTRLSKHNIYAVIKPHQYNSFSYQTESKTVTYDPDGVVPVWTKMSFFNHHPVHLVNTEVLFNHATNKATPKSYGYSNEEGYNTDFTFEINLSDNDTTKVYAVALHIWGEGPDGGETITWAHYNKRKGHWIAYAKFNTRNIPNSVFVEPFYNHTYIGSRNAMDEPVGWFDDQFKEDEGENAELMDDISALIAQGEAAVAAGNESAIPSAQIDQKLTQYLQANGIDINNATGTMTVDELLAESDALWTEVGGIADYFADLNVYAQKLSELAAVAEGITTGTAAGMTAASLTSQGFSSDNLDDGSNVYTKGLDDGGWEYVDLKNNLHMTVSGEAAARLNILMKAGSGDGSWMSGLEKMGEYLDKFQDYLGKIAEIAEASISKFTYWIWKAEKASEELGKKLTDPNLSRLQRWWLESKLSLNLTKTEGLTKIKNFCTKFKVGKAVGSLASLYSLVSTYMKFRANGIALNNIRKSVPNPCPDDQQAATKLVGDIDSFGRWCVPYMIAAISSDVVALAAATGCFVALIPSGGTSFSGLALSLAKIGLTIASNAIYEERMEAALEVFAYRKSELVCNRPCKETNSCPKCTDPNACPPYPKDKKGPYKPTTTGELDPSGFVYEGVESNRLEGATATVFFKETVKNIFGEDEDKVTLWNAEDFGQVNPQLTDENGEYGWMVPAGLWQVKYEKAGYRTEYSDWLPVPPPQLDVNQAMMQYAAPQVASVKATPQAVQIGFDKYMTGSSLKGDGNITVTREGQIVAGRVELDNAQGLTEQTMLAQKARFVPTSPLPAGKTLKLTVNGAVQSYAGVEMGSIFSQEFDIVQAVEQLVADSAVHVPFEQTATLTVRALPAAAAAGKKVTAKVLSDMIATIAGTNVGADASNVGTANVGADASSVGTTNVGADASSVGTANVGADASSVGTTELTLDAEGKATLTLTGEDIGTTAVVLQMQDDPDMQAVVMVNVKDEFVCPMPEANFAGGIVLALGSLITLSCELPEATIYYSLDGTCPCETNSPSVKRYEGPITFTGNMTIKAVATAPGYADSDVAEFTFLLTAISSLPTSQPQPAKGTYTLSGQKLQKDAALQKGVYIIDGKKVVVR